MLPRFGKGAGKAEELLDVIKNADKELGGVPNEAVKPGTIVDEFLGTAEVIKGIGKESGDIFNTGSFTRKVFDSANTSGSALITRNLMTNHAIERLAERGITKAMVDKTIERGIRYLDNKNGTFSFVLNKGFASGKTIQVATDVGVIKVVTV